MARTYAFRVKEQKAKDKNTPALNRAHAVDYPLLAVAIALLAFGLIMVYSASSPSAYIYQKGDSAYYFKYQFIWAVIGVVAMVFMIFYDYRNLSKHIILIAVVCLSLLIAVLIPGIGIKLNGARRWINLGITTFQADEAAKLGVILLLSHSLAKNYPRLEKFWKGLVPYIMLVGAFDALIVLEPHNSCVLIITLTAGVILIAAGAKIKHFVAVALVLIGVAAVLVMIQPYVLQRVFTFLDPWSDTQGTGYQIIQSLYAIGSGGILGLGLGKSRQKFLFIPEPQNDFIFSILAEELGLIGVILVIVLFMIFIYRGIKIARHAPNLFGTLTATGITSMIAIQVILNVAVVTSSMPVTGIPLPFFSYGGTALLFNFIEVGILLSISRYTKPI